MSRFSKDNNLTPWPPNHSAEPTLVWPELEDVTFSSSTERGNDALSRLRNLGLGLCLAAVALGAINSDVQHAPYDPYAVLAASPDTGDPFATATTPRETSTSAESSTTSTNSSETTATAATTTAAETTTASTASSTGSAKPTLRTHASSPAVKPTPKTAPATTTEAPKATPEIQPGIEMSPPTRMVLKNPDGEVLADVTIEPYAGEFVGYAADGTPLYNIEPPVAESPGDNRANYISWAGMPNTLPASPADTAKTVAQQDDNPIIASHSTNHQNDPSRYLAFQLVKDAKVGAVADVYTAKGVFEYKLESSANHQEIKKLDLENSDFMWSPVKNDLVVITCAAAIQADGSRVPAGEEQNIVLRMQLVAAKKGDFAQK